MSGNHNSLKRICSRCITLLLAVLMLACILPDTAFASETETQTQASSKSGEQSSAAGSDSSETGTVTINFPVADIEFPIYKVGVINSDGDTGKNSSYDLVAPFDQYQADMRDSNAAATLAVYITSNELQPLQTAKTDKDGIAVFTGLEAGVYLIPCVTAVTEDGTCTSQAILLELPQWNDKELSWNIAVDNKWEVTPPEEKTKELTVLKVWKNDDEDSRPESVTVELLQNGKPAEGITDEDGKSITQVTLSEENNWSYTWENLDASCSWTVLEKNVPAGYTVSNEADGTRIVLTNTANTPPDTETPGGSTPTKKLPKTGQLWWPVLVMIAAGLFCILIGLLVRRRD